MGACVLASVAALERMPRGSGADPVWFAAGGRVLGGGWLYALGALCVLPGLVLSLSQGGAAIGARWLQAALFALLLWRHPVPVLWVFLLPSLFTLARRRWLSALSLLPLLALLALGAGAAQRGYVSGVWLAPWELAVAVGAFALLWLRPPSASARVPKRTRGRAPARRFR